MKPGVTWQVNVRRQARETAREAARRCGMSVSEWLDSVIIHTAREEGIDHPQRVRAESQDAEYDEV